jgi:hypothetical protein
MPRVPRGPPIEPGILDIEHDPGALDLLRDVGRRDLARDPGWRDLADDPGRQDLRVLGVSPGILTPETFSISGGVLLLKRARTHPLGDAADEKSVGGPESFP